MSPCHLPSGSSAAIKRGEEGGGTRGEGTERKKKGGRKNKEPIEPLPNHNMVLLWRADADSRAGPSRLLFDGKNDADVATFFFVYENIVMQSKSDEDKAGELLCYL